MPELAQVLDTRTPEIEMQDFLPAVLPAYLLTGSDREQKMVFN